MQPYQDRLARLLAESGALFFRQGLRLKDGRPTPYFVNLGAFRTGRLAWELGSCFADFLVDKGLLKDAPVLLGPSYKGSAIAQGAAIALYRDHGLDLAFDYDRKEAKTHGEASGKDNMFVTGALQPGCKSLILDDVATSMATKFELLEKVAAFGQAGGAEVGICGVALAIDRQQTQAVYEGGRLVEGVKGADAVAAFQEKTGIPVAIMLGIGQAAESLASQGVEVSYNGAPRRMDAAMVKEIEDYLAIYGREA